MHKYQRQKRKRVYNTRLKRWKGKRQELYRIGRMDAKRYAIGLTRLK